ncbi:MAG TPA: hypothetical protein DDY17_07090 [Syntrophaceae bacterium]|jgi:hypothetical protein|nr:hypothetical protein [Syntrophaceae bacterium]
MANDETTDITLFVKTSSEDVTRWNRQRIVDDLIRETDIDVHTAELISREVEIGLAVVLIVTMFLSDLMNNAATAAVMCPIAISTAGQLGVNVDSFLMAVAVGASCFAVIRKHARRAANAYKIPLQRTPVATVCLSYESVLD